MEGKSRTSSLIRALMLTIPAGLLLASCAETAVEEPPKPTMAHTQVELNPIIIATGGVTGVYYPSGGAICRFYKSRGPRRGMCGVESTGGSYENLKLLREGEVNFAIVHSWWQDSAYRGTNRFSSAGRFDKLRSVFSLYGEPLTLVAAQQTGVREVSEVRDNRIDIGRSGSLERMLIENLMDARNWSLSVFSSVAEYGPFSDKKRAFCDGRVQIISMAVGHPSGTVNEVTSRCGGMLVSITGPDIRQQVAHLPAVSQSVIPGGMYRNNPSDIITFGYRPVVVTRSDVPDVVVYSLVKSIFENLKEFRRLHPAFQRLSEEKMARESIAAPVHAGALKYYREAGLL